MKWLIEMRPRELKAFSKPILNHHGNSLCGVLSSSSPNSCNPCSYHKPPHTRVRCFVHENPSLAFNSFFNNQQPFNTQAGRNRRRPSNMQNNNKSHEKKSEKKHKENGSAKRTITTEVAVVGCGPVGAVAGCLASQLGMKVLVLEKETTEHGQSRAVGVDDEAMRLYQNMGVSSEFMDSVYQCDAAKFVNQHGKVWMEFIPKGKDFGNGYQPFLMFHQPLLEKCLRELLIKNGAELKLGEEVIGVKHCKDQDGEYVRLKVQSCGKDNKYTYYVRAQYVLACDGARSPIRRHCKIPFQASGTTYKQPWMVILGTIKKEYRDEVSFPQISHLLANPHRPGMMTMSLKDQFRWEVMLLENEDPEEMVKNQEFINKIVSMAIDPKYVEIIRTGIYTFRNLTAEKWSHFDERLFLVGDAAHVMPPFMGQGLNSGLRDASNIVWKIHSVLKMNAPRTLLLSYEAERKPHTKAMQDVSMKLGKVFMTTNVTAAWMRDAWFTALQKMFPKFKKFVNDVKFRPVPRYESGWMLKKVKGLPKCDGVGTLFIQPKVRKPGVEEEILLDYLLDIKFSFLVNERNLLELPEEQRNQIWSSIQEASKKIGNAKGFKIVEIEGDSGERKGTNTDKEVQEERSKLNESEANENAILDSQGKLGKWFASNKVDFVILRPDHFVYAAAKFQHFNQVMNIFETQITAQ